MTRNTTMLDLVADLTRYARSDDDVVATVVSLVNSGAVRLCGSFKGQRFEASLGDPSAGRARVSTEPTTVRLYLSGQRFDLWEDPARPFGCAPADLASYLDRGDWVQLFNALALTGGRRDSEPGS